MPIPRVAPEDRLLFMALPVPGLYRCVARYGYTDAVDRDGEFTRAVLARVAKYSAPEAAARLLGPADQVRGASCKVAFELSSSARCLLLIFYGFQYVC